MFGLWKSPNNNNSDPNKNTITPARRTSSEPLMPTAGKDEYKNDFKDSGGFENQSVQELENYAVYKSEDTTNTVNNCRRIAEDIRDDASKTLVTLHHQGEQITRTHNTAVAIDQDLTKGEKLLGNLGGMFSMPWKAKKTRAIKGPVTMEDENLKNKVSHLEQREKLGIAAPKGKSKTQQASSESTTAMQKIEMEKSKQEDGLDDLSNILGDLKSMAVNMGTELERQNNALDHLQDDVEELNSRVKGANQRGRKLLGK